MGVAGSLQPRPLLCGAEGACNQAEVCSSDIPHHVFFVCVVVNN